MCETPKSPPGDYNQRQARRRSLRLQDVCVKHLNPRQGITTPSPALDQAAQYAQCETPKSPPGDYNMIVPRSPVVPSVWACETPKSPPGDYNFFRVTASHAPQPSCETPKSPPGDYNPQARASLTPWRLGSSCETPKSPPGDYNASDRGAEYVGEHRMCETPKSPPGDYNRQPGGSSRYSAYAMCETPKSPPGDYNSFRFQRGSLERDFFV